MDPTLPWYKSAIIRQQVVQLLVAGAAFFGVVTDVDWSATVEAIFAGIAAAVAVWTIITRLFKPAPNMTQTAAAKELAMVKKGAHPTQGGYAVLDFLKVVACIGLLFVAVGLPFVMQGCAGTQAAYREAKDSLADTAYVATEHYAAVLHEAADLREQPGTPAAVVKALQDADRIMKPFVIGDPARQVPSLQSLADSYMALPNAKTEAELQAAVDNAIRELTKFSRAVKAAKAEVQR